MLNITSGKLCFSVETGNYFILKTAERDEIGFKGSTLILQKRMAMGEEFKLAKSLNILTIISPL